MTAGGDAPTTPLPPGPPLRLGTRGSALATAQSAAVAAALTAALGRPVELVVVRTAGDTDPRAISELGGTGVFVSALRDALRAGTVDLAVHSLKDLPTRGDGDAGLLLAATPLREDPRDALCHPGGLTLGELAPGSRVGTGSPRRAAQLHALGLGLDVVPVRGNVDTRLGLAERGAVDAVVLARAGLARLDRLVAVSETLDPLTMLPAPGQGALAVEVRRPADPADGADPDAVLAAAVAAALDDPDTRAAVTAERALLAALEAGCTAPVGALADVADDELYLRAVVGGELRRSVTGPRGAPADLGARLAAVMLDDGAAALLASAAPAPPPQHPPDRGGP